MNGQRSLVEQSLTCTAARDMGGVRRRHPHPADQLAELVADQRTTFRAIADRIDQDRKSLDALVGLDHRAYHAMLEHAALCRKAAEGVLLPEPDEEENRR